MTPLVGQAGVVTKNPGWYGRIIQWFTASPAYHVVFYVIDKDGAEWLVSAETPTVILRRVDYFDGVLWTAVDYENDIRREQAVTFALAQVGKPYSYVDILFLAIAGILRQKTPLIIRRRVQDRSQWFCSELADAALQAGGVDLFPGRPDQAVLPADFLKVIRKAR